MSFIILVFVTTLICAFLALLNWVICYFFEMALDYVFSYFEKKKGKS